MVIQEILFPEVGKCTEKRLYFRMSGSNNYAFSHKKITLKKNQKVKFNTYFNGLSIEKWRKYTNIKKVSLSINLKGTFKVTLLEYKKIRDDVFKKVLNEEVVEAEDSTNFVFDYADDGKGMLTFNLTALSDKAEFLGGEYISDVPEEVIRDVKIGICICTFKRESYIENNIKLLNKSILKNKQSLLKDKLEVLISDNGQTLDSSRLSSDHVHIFKNRNLGGAGGFTRDLIEIIKNNSRYNITHALLMDDDVIIEPKAIEKTFTILSILKEEYIDAFIGGAMFHRDKQNIQVEAGAVWNGGDLISLKSGLDLNYLNSCLYNEVEEYAEFNAWWYCCFPISIVREDNLPLPIFIRGDDLEYGIRNMKHLILMNGICLWHEPFEYKYSSFLNYYIIRNQLIDNSFHCNWYRAKDAIKVIKRTCLKEILLYRYKNVDLYLRGVNDFLKGPEFLLQTDGEALHKEIMASGYRAVELDTLDVEFNYPIYDKTRHSNESKLRKIKRIITLNGWLLPAHGTTIVPVETALTNYNYRIKKVLNYDVAAHKGFVCEKSYSEAIRCGIKTLMTCAKVWIRMKKVQKEFRTDGLKLRMYEFWKGYLDLV